MSSFLVYFDKKKPLGLAGSLNLVVSFFFFVACMFVFVFDFFVFLPKLQLMVVKSSPWNRAIQLLLRIFFLIRPFRKFAGFMSTNH